VDGLITTTNRLLVSVAGGVAMLWSSKVSLLGFLLLAIFTTVVAAVGYFIPKTNWDIFGYLASAYEAPGMTADMLHRHAYETVRQAVPTGDFLVLTQDRDYRTRQYADPQAFFTMLGFYRTKFLYVEMIGWLSALTDPLNAIRLVSAISAAAIGALTISWIWTYRALHLAPLAIAALVLSGFGELARVGTPDAFSAALFVAGIFAFLRKREALTAVLLFLAFLARPDHAAYLGVLVVVSLFMRSFSWGALAAFVAALAAYVPITQAAGHPGWWIQMWFTNLEYVETLDGFDPPFSVLAYLKIIARVVTRSLIEQQWVAVLIVSCAVWWQLLQNHITIAGRGPVVLIATLLAICAKFVVFPLYDTRFHFAYLLVFCLTLIGALSGIRFRLPKAAG
jgi:hypothetical protein